MKSRHIKLFFAISASIALFLCIVLFYSTTVYASSYNTKSTSYPSDDFSWPTKTSAYIWDGWFDNLYFGLPQNYEYTDDEDNENVTNPTLDPDYVAQYGYHRWKLISVTRSNKKVIFATKEMSHKFKDNSSYTLSKEPAEYVPGYTPGKCTLTLKFTEYTLDPNTGAETCATITKECIVTIKRYKSLEVFAELSKYSTRNNAFTMKVRNLTNKTITIYSNRAKSQDCDYKSYDRNLKLTGGKRYIKLKPGQKKTINFKVIGSATWPKVEDEWLINYWKYNGKTYKIKIDCGSAKKRASGKWKSIDKSALYMDNDLVYGLDY